jgi:hypothetical protein
LHDAARLWIPAASSQTQIGNPAEFNTAIENDQGKPHRAMRPLGERQRVIDHFRPTKRAASALCDKAGKEISMMRSHFLRAAPGMPSRNIKRTIEHYARLGFSATRTTDEFAILELDGIELHFALKPDHDPARTATWIYIRVKDVDAFYRDMKAVGVGLKEPHDTDYGMREIPHVDPDNNLVLFGSTLPSR